MEMFLAIDHLHCRNQVSGAGDLLPACSSKDCLLAPLGSRGLNLVPSCAIAWAQRKGQLSNKAVLDRELNGSA